jgi:hypothetical protein
MSVDFYCRRNFVGCQPGHQPELLRIFMGFLSSSAEFSFVCVPSYGQYCKIRRQSEAERVSTSEGMQHSTALHGLTLRRQYSRDALYLRSVKHNLYVF